MEKVKTIHVLGLICIADICFGTGGALCLLILLGYGVYKTLQM